MPQSAAAIAIRNAPGTATSGPLMGASLAWGGAVPRRLPLHPPRSALRRNEHAVDHVDDPVRGRDVDLRDACVVHEDAVAGDADLHRRSGERLRRLQGDDRRRRRLAADHVVEGARPSRRSRCPSRGSCPGGADAAGSRSAGTRAMPSPGDQRTHFDLAPAESSRGTPPSGRNSTMTPCWNGSRTALQPPTRRLASAHALYSGQVCVEVLHGHSDPAAHPTPRLPRLTCRAATQPSNHAAVANGTNTP